MEKKAFVEEWTSGFVASVLLSADRPVFPSEALCFRSSIENAIVEFFGRPELVPRPSEVAIASGFAFRNYGPVDDKEEQLALWP